MQTITKNLVYLNNVVHVDDFMCCCGLHILVDAVTADPLLALTEDSITAATAASLWIAIKLVGIRVRSPNTVLMATAAGVSAPRLRSAELRVLTAVGFHPSRIPIIYSTEEL